MYLVGIMQVRIVHTSEVAAAFADDVVAFLAENARICSFVRCTEVAPELLDSRLREAHAGDMLLDWAATDEVLQSFQGEHTLVLLTTRGNLLNFFAFGEEGRYVVDVSGWADLLGAHNLDLRLPVAHQIALCLLLDAVFGSVTAAAAAAHHPPRGCQLDLCLDKREVALKMRTADTCPSCMELFAEAIDNERLTPLLLHDMFRVLDAVRSQLLYRERQAIAQAASPIEIRGPRRQLWFTDHQAELRLPPQEHVLYLLYLWHRDQGPLAFEDVGGHLDLLVKWDGEIAGNRHPEEVRRAFQALVDPRESRLSEKFSKIRRRIAELVGPEAAAMYLWPSSDRGARRLPADLDIRWLSPA